MQHKQVSNPLLANSTLLYIAILQSYAFSLILGTGPNGFGTSGGIGCEAGGGAGGASSAGFMHAGGNGAKSLVYIEWD